jgi:hypothetical protein
MKGMNEALKSTRMTGSSVNVGEKAKCIGIVSHKGGVFEDEVSLKSKERRHEKGGEE